MGCNQNVEDTIGAHDDDDIAIIGAGIAGSYAAWRLREAGLKITLYEYSDRIGGRCHTVKFPDIPDINVELGAMRFYPSEHKLLTKAISDLGLQTMDFLPDNTDVMYHLRGQHITSQELPERAPYGLKPEHRKHPGELNWDIFQSFTNVDPASEDYKNLPNILNYRTPDGIPLYKQSHECFSGKFLYPELSSYLQDTSGSVSIYQNVSASKSIPVKNPQAPSYYSVYKTVVEGFQAVPETMVQKFLDSSKRHKLKKNHHLRSITKRKDGTFTLILQPTQTTRGVTKESECDCLKIHAKVVFLAIPRLALERLDWDVLKEPTTSNYLKNSLYEAYAAKSYCSYDKPWWRKDNNSGSTVYSTTPLRLTNDFGVSKQTGKAVSNPAFTDLNTQIWRDALNQGTHVPGVDDDTIQMTDIAVNMTRKFLAEIYGLSELDVPQPNYSIMRIWDEYPYGASWYYFKPGYLWTEVADHMIKPSKQDNVYIISNTFSGTCQQAWLEGALEIVDKMLRTYFSEVIDV